MKVLIVRFSSIGDIVLTTPVLRALKEQISDVEVHYITKAGFKEILFNNPHIDRLFTIEQSISEVLPSLRMERYDYIIDLHNNVRTLSLKLKLFRPSSTLPKLNIRKWLLVNMKWDAMPDVHVVDRYFQALKPIGVINENKTCDFFIAPEDEISTLQQFGLNPKEYISIAIGAQFYTKRFPLNKLKELIEKVDYPIILVGGPTDQNLAEELIEFFSQKNIQSACGNFKLGQSASIVRQSAAIISNDTGLMHIATCFGIPVISIWGNTVPSLGMYPYYPENNSLYTIHEVQGLSCRPCSKIGFAACPKGHFNCMQHQNSDEIANDIKKFLN